MLRSLPVGPPPKRRLVIKSAALCLAFVCSLHSLSAAAQTPGPADIAPPGGVALSVGYEYARDRYFYEFANPSNITTPFLVPHTFRQTYTADNQWLVGSVRYEALGQWLETDFGITPEITTFGSDQDTFYNPDNVVITSGTAGDVRLRSFRFTQWSEGKIGKTALRFGYRFRQDRADYLPADLVVVSSNGQFDSRRFTTDEEETISRVQELIVDVARSVPLSGRWRMVLGGNVSPLLLARLTTRLPDKYPGVDIVADARSAGLGARAQIVQEGGGLRPVFGVSWGKTWSYDSERQYDRNVLQLSFRVIWRP